MDNFFLYFLIGSLTIISSIGFYQLLFVKNYYKGFRVTAYALIIIVSITLIDNIYQRQKNLKLQKERTEFLFKKDSLNLPNKSMDDRPI